MGHREYSHGTFDPYFAEDAAEAEPLQTIPGFPRLTSRSASAPIAPHQAVAVGIRATASSVSGKRIPSGVACGTSTPKSMTAPRELARSASLATPATTKTKASSKRALNRPESSIRAKGVFAEAARHRVQHRKGVNGSCENPWRLGPVARLLKGQLQRHGFTHTFREQHPGGSV